MPALARPRAPAPPEHRCAAPSTWRADDSGLWCSSCATADQRALEEEVEQAVAALMDRRWLAMVTRKPAHASR